MRVVDLFSGLGGFSEGFLQRGHDVSRYDNDSRFEAVPNTVIRDVFDLTADDLRGADVVLASPPCQCFSIAAVSHHWPNNHPTPRTEEAIRLVKYTISLISQAGSHWWILENPVGMLRNVLGRPDKTVCLCAWGKEAKKPTDLWGNLPPIDWRMPMKWEKAPRGAKKGVQGYTNPAEAAKIPYDFSLAICLACEGNSPQMTLQEAR